MRQQRNSITSRLSPSHVRKMRTCSSFARRAELPGYGWRRAERTTHKICSRQSAGCSVATANPWICKKTKFCCPTSPDGGERKLSFVSARAGHVRKKRKAGRSKFVKFTMGAVVHQSKRSAENYE